MQSIQFEQQSITPSKIICVGRNYVEHIHELGNEVPEQMVLFIKPNSAITQTLAANHNGEALHYEAELCFLYWQGKFVAIGTGLDLTKRGLQSQLKAKGLPWERAKAFNGSALFGQFIAIPDDLAKVSFHLAVDGEVRQQGDLSLMMYKPDEILAEVSSFMALEDGDVVMTGTPKGVDQINLGEQFTLTLVTKEKAISCQWQAG